MEVIQVTTIPSAEQVLEPEVVQTRPRTEVSLEDIEDLRRILESKVPRSELGQPNGVGQLDEHGQIVRKILSEEILFVGDIIDCGVLGD